MNEASEYVQDLATYHSTAKMEFTISSNRIPALLLLSLAFVASSSPQQLEEALLDLAAKSPPKDETPSLNNLIGSVAQLTGRLLEMRQLCQI